MQAPSILYITSSKRGKNRYQDDPSVIYRCFNTTSELRNEGFDAYVCHEDEVPLNFHPDIVFFHRPRVSESFNYNFERYSNSIKVCDLDDLLFDIGSVDEHPALLSGKISRNALSKEIKNYREALNKFSYFTVSSIPLQESLNQFLGGANSVVYRNGIHQDWYAYGSQFPGRKKNDNKVISYFSGSDNHLSDLNNVIEPINEFLSMSPKAIVRIFGYLQPIKGEFSDRWKIIPPVQYYQLPKYIKESWLAIAPLNNTLFNRCKSAVKFLEAGAYSVPLVASQIDEYERLENPGLKLVNGQGWCEIFNQFKDDSLYENARLKSNEFAVKESVKNNIKPLLQWLKSILR